MSYELNCDMCGSYHIKMNTIQCQAKKKIFIRFKVPGFINLIKSSNILKKKIGLIESRPNIIEIKLGNAVQVFDHYNSNDNYFYALRDINFNYILVFLKSYDH